MRIRHDEGEEDFVLNLVPMIDMVFQLLIFYMLATTFIVIEKDLDVDLPEAVAGESEDAVPDELVINLLKDGRMTVSGTELDETGLKAAIDRAAQRNKETPVTIRGDKEVTHGRIVHVMDACGVAGLTRLQIGTTEGS